MVERACHVASRTSDLVDVETTGPLLASTLGMISALVFPGAVDRERGPIAEEVRSATRLHPDRDRRRGARSERARRTLRVRSGLPRPVCRISFMGETPSILVVVTF